MRTYLRPINTFGEHVGIMQMLLITLLVLAALAAGVITFFLLRLRTQHLVLQTEHSTLRTDHDRLTEQHKLLAEQNTTLDEQQNALTRQYDELTGRHEALVELNKSIIKEHDVLTQDNKILSELQEIVNKKYNDLYRTHAQLKGEYEQLEEEYQQFKDEYENAATLKAIQNLRSNTKGIEDEPLARMQRIAQGHIATAQLNRAIKEEQVVYPEEKKVVLQKIQTLLDHKHAGKDYAKMEFESRDPLPGNEDIDHAERSCVALGATAATGKRVHVSEIVLEALQNGGWETNATKAHIAVQNMYNAIRASMYNNRVQVKNYTVMLRGSKPWFHFKPKPASDTTPSTDA